MKPVKIGERIRYYRSLLNITREELADQQMSTNLIKYIECGNKNLTLRKAIVLADTLNKIAVEKCVQIFITTKDLLEPEEECARKVCWEELKKLENGTLDIDKCNAVLSLAQEYELNEILIDVYEKIASYYFSNEKYTHSMKFLNKILEIDNHVTSSKYIVKALNTLGACYSMLNDYALAYENYKKSYENFIKIEMDNPKLESKILYNLALCSKKLNKYDDTLSYINKLLSMNEYEESAFINAMILKANLCLASEKYEDALNLYKSISTFGPKYLYIIQHNTAVAFIKLNRVDESIDYLSKSINAQININSSAITFSLIDLGSIYRIENLYKPAIIFYEHALNSALKFNQINEIIECFDVLKNLYIYTKSDKSCNQLNNKITRFYYNTDFLDEFQKQRIGSLLTRI